MCRENANVHFSTCCSQPVFSTAVFQYLSLNEFGDETCAKPSLRAQRSNPDCLSVGILDCFAALAMRGERRSCCRRRSIWSYALPDFVASASATAVRMSATENGLVITSCAIACRLDA